MTCVAVAEDVWDLQVPQGPRLSDGEGTTLEPQVLPIHSAPIMYAVFSENLLLWTSGGATGV